MIRKLNERVSHPAVQRVSRRRGEHGHAHIRELEAALADAHVAHQAAISAAHAAVYPDRHGFSHAVAEADRELNAAKERHRRQLANLNL